MKRYFVEIFERESGTVEKRIACLNERIADKVEHGALINLNHELYFTRIVEEEVKEKLDKASKRKD